MRIDERTVCWLSVSRSEVSRATDDNDEGLVRGSAKEDGEKVRIIMDAVRGFEAFRIIIEDSVGSLP